MPRAKKIGIALLVLFLLFLLILAALPLWLPLLAAPALNRFGVEYETYERQGYNRFVLEEVRYSSEQVEARAERVEAFLPFGWWWHRWRGSDDVEYVVATDWRVEVKEKGPEAPHEERAGEGEISLPQIFEDLDEVLPTVIDWAPRARLGPGRLIVAGRLLEVGGATWREGVVSAEVFDPEFEQRLALEGDVSGGLPYVLRGETDPFPFGVEVVISREEDGLAVAGEGRLMGNRLVGEAEFPREGLWPTRAVLRSDHFLLPPEYLKLDGYDEVAGSLLLEWRDGRFVADVRGEAEPLAGREDQLPRLRLSASARGDLESVVVEGLEIRSPWLVAILSDPVALDYTGELLTEASVFRLAANLAEQPFVDLRGALEGEVRISPGEERLPLVEFALAARELAGFDLELDRVEARGSFQWPELAVAELRVDAPDESWLTAAANLDLETMEIEGGGVEAAVRPGLLAPWLPEGVSFTAAELRGAFEGAIRELSHRGRLAAEELTLPAAHPMDGQFEWQGRLANLSEFGLELAAGEGRLRLDGSSEFEEQRLALLLRQMRLERAGESLFESTGASRFGLEWGEEQPLTVSLDELRWVGEEREIQASAAVAWPERGEFSAYVRDFTTDLFSDFLDLGAGFFTVATARAAGSWEDGPVQFETTAEVRVDFAGADEILFEVSARGEERHLEIGRLRASSRGEDLALAEGLLPVSLRPARPDLLRIHGTGEIDFRARTAPGAHLWERIGELTGVLLEDPAVSLEIAGTPYEPSGYIRGVAPLVQVRALDEREQPAPVLKDLRLSTLFDVERVRVDELSVLVEGQRVELQADLPMGTRQWREMVQEWQLPGWERAEGRLRIPRAELAAFAPFAPGVLSPQGSLEADVRILPDGMLDGVILIEDLATRPLMPLGALREGSVRITLRERTAHFEEISAVIGGERLLLTGDVDLPFEQPLAFEVNLRGRNIPLTRRPGVVVRGDLDLSVRSREGEIPLVSGQVGLRNSYYLAHLRLMPAGGVATPERRPPFFSIGQEPFADWRLNVDLRGPDFMEVRGPIFQGGLSANFNLSGTLVEPVAIGTLTIDDGRVRFPFATLRIEPSEIALRREDPFQPQLFIIATGMAFGYDLRMEITGTAENPVVEFVSNPPLTSEQALLMVTTGELPREEIRFSTQQRATRFAIYLGRNLLYELTEDDSAGEKLQIRTGEQVSESGRETMVIEYRLGNDVSLVGEYDRFDEYNAGLKWNIYSR